MAKRDDRDRKNNRDLGKYKSDLEKLFRNDGSATPERFKGVMDSLAPEEGSEEAAWREQVDALREVEGFRDFVQAVNTFHREGHRMPDDEDLLTRMLDHPSERILRDVLTHLLDLHRRRTVHRTGPIKSRLSTIRTMSEDPRTLKLVEELQEAFG